MAQVQNLLDLFQKNLRDAQAAAGAESKPAPRAVPGNGAAAKAGRNAGTLLPIDPGQAAQGSKPVTHAPASFRAKLEKSTAKLAPKAPAAKPDTASRPAAPAGTEAPKAKTEPSADRNEGAPRARGPRDARPGKPQERRAGPDAQDRGQASKPDQATPDAAPAAAARAEGPEDDAGQAKGLDEKSKEAIKKGLADLGVQVDDEQLEDPAFLESILRILQAVPAQALPSDEARTDAPAEAAEASSAPDPAAGPAAPGTAAGDPSAEAQTQTPGAAEAAGTAGTKPQGEASKPAARKELVRLLENRIAGLERAADGQAGRLRVSAQAPTVTPKEWQGVQARPQAEGPSPDPLPLADLDRLRVLQASALQTAPAKEEAAGPRTQLVLESDSVEPAGEPAAAAHAEGGRDASAAQDQDPQTDLFGRNGDQAAGAQGLAPKDGAQAAKDGAAGPQFHQVLDQARAIEHRAAAGPAAEPRAPLHDTALLEQIARKMSATAHKSGDEISIQLTPEHLGKVRVNLEMKEDGMSARIAVENDSVRKQVESNLASLKDALKDQGIQLQGLEVSVDQRHASLFNPDGSNAESFFRRQGGGNGRGDSGAEAGAPDFEAAPETDTGRRWGYNTLEFIG